MRRCARRRTGWPVPSAQDARRKIIAFFDAHLKT